LHSFFFVARGAGSKYDRLRFIVSRFLRPRAGLIAFSKKSQPEKTKKSLFLPARDSVLNTFLASQTLKENPSQ